MPRRAATKPKPNSKPKPNQVSLLDAETGSLVSDEAALRLMAEEWKEREGARKQDHLGALTLSLPLSLTLSLTLSRTT